MPSNYRDIKSGALSGIRVLDLTTNHTGYAARLLSDLGATVMRPVAHEEQPPAGTADDLFLHAGKQLCFPSDVNIEKLAAESDIIFESSAFNDGAFSFDPECLLRDGAKVAIVSFTPYGLEKAGTPATDLTILASGGLLSLGGYPDGEPIAISGEQSLLAAGIFGAVAALAALLDQDETRSGQWLDVSAQECVAFALEDAVPDFFINSRTRRRHGDAAREAGTGIYKCRDGYVSIVAGRLGTAKGWAALRGWIAEVGAEGSNLLSDPRWDDFEFRGRPESISQFAEIFSAFAANFSKQELYIEGQRRQIAIAPVNGIGDLFVNAQLLHSNYFKSFRDAEGRELKLPGAPYRLSVTPAQVPASSPFALDGARS